MPPATVSGPSLADSLWLATVARMGRSPAARMSRFNAGLIYRYPCWKRLGGDRPDPEPSGGLSTMEVGPMRRVPAVLLALLVATLSPVAATAAKGPNDPLDRIDHIVVIYEENHSFDNLYGGWPGVDNRATAPNVRTLQSNQAGAPFACLLQNDVNLVPSARPPGDLRRHDDGDDLVHQPLRQRARSRSTRPSRRPPRPVRRPASSPPTACSTAPACPAAAPATSSIASTRSSTSSTAGRMDRYVTGSDAAGLVMGYYDTTQLPDLPVPHRARAPELRDRGPLLPGCLRRVVPQPPVAGRCAHAGLRERCAVGRRTTSTASSMRTASPTHLPALRPTRRQGRRADRAVRRLDAGRPPLRRLRGQHDPAVVPAVQPGHGRRPASPAPDHPDHRGRAERGARQLGLVLGWLVERGRPHRRARLDERHRPDVLRPGHRVGRGLPELPGQALPVPPPVVQLLRVVRAGDARRARTHLRDETEFRRRAGPSSRSCRLPQVSFVKPVGAENEHPGYASETAGSEHLVDLIKAVEGSACARNTMVVVTYDEFGGQWDHVPPPGPGKRDVRVRRPLGPRNPGPGPGRSRPWSAVGRPSTPSPTTRRRSSPPSSTASAWPP